MHHETSPDHAMAATKRRLAFWCKKPRIFLVGKSVQTVLWSSRKHLARGFWRRLEGVGLQLRGLCSEHCSHMKLLAPWRALHLLLPTQRTLPLIFSDCVLLLASVVSVRLLSLTAVAIFDLSQKYHS